MFVVGSLLTDYYSPTKYSIVYEYNTYGKCIIHTATFQAVVPYATHEFISIPLLLLVLEGFSGLECVTAA
jgi:hypothetical protein